MEASVILEIVLLRIIGPVSVVYRDENVKGNTNS
jgi:hypothetical protein